MVHVNLYLYEHMTVQTKVSNIFSCFLLCHQLTELPEFYYQLWTNFQALKALRQ